MKILLLLFMCALVIYEVQPLSEKCDHVEECHTTNYHQYVDCIRKRQKRSIDCNSPCDSDNCINSCNECDCSSCSYSSCQNSCNSCCSTCCSNYNACTSNHCCHKVCHAQCRSSSCRSSCRNACYDRIKNIDESSNQSSSQSSSGISDNRHNITTIIHLNNVINNTNIIDVPISLNNTNYNNITLYEKDYRGTSISNNHSNQSDNCCTVISPRQCVPQKEFPFIRCFHYRSRQCGSYCTAPIVHKEQQQVCEVSYPGSAPSCRQSVMYIPQPQPRCTYQSTWPYVACGLPRSVSCAGCYSHYVNQEAQDYTSCSSACYDNGYGVGPYYRQGPFYRPTYTHMPCYSCYGYGGYSSPYGGYPGIGAYPGNGGYSGFGGYPGYGTPPGYGGAYPSFSGYPPYAAGSGFVDPEMMPYGSWSPEVENPFIRPNNTNSSIEPIFDVGPDIMSNTVVLGNPYRGVRELEIDVNYDELQSSAETEVEIKAQNVTTKKEYNDNDSEIKNPTVSTPLESKLS